MDFCGSDSGVCEGSVPNFVLQKNTFSVLSWKDLVFKDDISGSLRPSSFFPFSGLIDFLESFFKKIVESDCVKN